MAENRAPDPFARVLFVAVIGLLAGLGVGGLFAREAAQRAGTEFDRRTATLPKTFAVANADAIVRGNVAALRAAVEGLLGGPIADEADLLYTFVLDPDGNLLASAYAEDVPPYDRRLIEDALRVPAPGGSAGPAPPPDAERESARERLGLQEARPAVEPERQRPFRPVAAFQKTPGRAGEIRYVDVAMPIIVAGSRWGAIRMGFRDEAAETALGRWTVGALAALFALAFTAFAAVLGSRGIAERQAEHTAEEMAALRRRFEKALAEAKPEESGTDAPLTPQEFFALLDAAKDLGACLGEDEVLDTAARLAVGLLHARDVSIFLLEPAGQTLVGRIGHGEGGIVGPDVMGQVTVPVGQGEIGMAAEFGTTAVIDDPRPGSGVVSALISRGQTLGVLLARNKTTGRPFLKRDRLIARLLAQFTANALHVARALRASGEGFHTPVENPDRGM